MDLLNSLSPWNNVTTGWTKTKIPGLYTKTRTQNSVSFSTFFVTGYFIHDTLHAICFFIRSL